MADLTPEGISAIISSIFAGVALILRSRRVQSKAAQTPAEKPTPLEQYAEVPDDPAGQREFMRILMADAIEQRREITSLRTALTEMQGDLAADKTWKSHFLDALGRWLAKIAREYGSRGAVMPMPDGDDLVVLQEVVPRG